MLRFPAEWVQSFGADLASAVAPQIGARFRYHERVRPQPAFSAILERVLASDPDFTVREVGELVRLVTVEGEYGALVAIRGMREGSHAMRYVGAVFMDEFATVLDVIALAPERFATVEQHAWELVRAQRFEIPHRPRLFFYVPPVDWHALPAGLTANWYPLDFPKNLTNIVVPPAVHVTSDAESAIASAEAELGAGLAVGATARTPFTSATGVAGVHVRLDGTREDRTLHRELVMFVVDSRAYRMRLETANAARLFELREQFLATAGSFRPLPGVIEVQLGRAFAQAPDVFDHWVS